MYLLGERAQENRRAFEAAYLTTVTEVYRELVKGGKDAMNRLPSNLINPVCETRQPCRIRPVLRQFTYRLYL